MAKQLNTVCDTVDENAQIANILQCYDVVRAYGQWAAGNQLLSTDQTKHLIIMRSRLS